MIAHATNDPAPRATLPPAHEQFPGPFARGQRVADTYEVTGVLGAGGMGVVYEAHDLLLDRMVALKVPLLPRYAEALRLEAQAMAAIHHPNLVAIHAAGREGGVAFIVMERVFGMTLEDRILEAWETARPIPIDDALGVLVAITDAITAIHGAGAAHRDIKAANVMVSGERVVLTDFGLVTPEVSVHPGMPVAGSADYMAPELILGTLKQGRGPLVDLYALGVVAFEVLTGRRPYEAATTHAALAAHVQQPVPDLRDHRADAPDDLADLVRELLAKSPDDRPVSAEAVLWRLGAIRADLARPSAAGSPAISVLIVDDDPDVGAMLKRNLQWTLPRLAAEVVTSAPEAIERMKHRLPDIVVVDLVMPEMSGMELSVHIGELPARSRPVIVAMGSSATPGDVALLRSLGVHAFVPKDAGFVVRMCEVIGATRRAQRAPHSRPSRTAPRH